MFFRNLSAETVRLNATILNRKQFKKLPNTVKFYTIADKPDDITWQSNALVSWTDSTDFYIDIPAKTVIDVSDISNGLILGSRTPDVLLIAAGKNYTDTVTRGDYLSLAAKFTYKKRFLTRPVYFYDWK